jgi:ElaB/YqjD/DUF883 family membrane-anchored ribosome-binding protein
MALRDASSGRTIVPKQLENIAMSDRVADAKEQIAKLRDQVDYLMRDRVSPALSDAADRAQYAAKQAGGVARDQAEALSGRVKEQPLLALVIAAAAGYLIGRIAR